MSEWKTKYPVLVVGAGLAGMAAAVRLAEQGTLVCLVADQAPGLCGSVCDGEGLNVAEQTPGGSDAEAFVADTLAFGGQLGHRGLVTAMARRSLSLADMAQRLGVLFDQTNEGQWLFTRQVGSTQARTLQAWPSLGRQLVTMLFEQVRRHVARGVITLCVPYEFRDVVLDDSGRCVGAVVQDLRTASLVALQADALIVATGDVAGFFGKKAVRGFGCLGGAIVSLIKRGAVLANAEFIGFVPAVCLADKSLQIPQDFCKNSEGFWVLRGGERFEFVKEWFSDQQNVSGHDMARAIERANQKFAEPGGSGPVARFAVDSKEVAGLSGLAQDWLEQVHHLTGVQEYRVGAAMCDWLGGLKVNDHHMTNLSGVFAAGRAATGYHGAAMLPGNRLLAILHGALTASEHARIHVLGLESHGDPAAASLFATVIGEQEQRDLTLADCSGPENPNLLYEEASEVMATALGPIRHKDTLAWGLAQINALASRLGRVSLSNQSKYLNGGLKRVRDLEGLFVLGKMMLEAAGVCLVRSA